MISKIYSAALKGLEAGIIEVEVAASQGLKAFNIVGLADTAIKEAKERVSSAIKSTSLKPPQHQRKRVLVSLAPADLQKQGSLYDLPIALGFLLADNQVRFETRSKIILGELALDGTLKPIKGALSFALLALEKGFEQIVLPKENSKEAAMVNLLAGQNNLEVIGAETLKQVIAFLTGSALLEPVKLTSQELQSSPASFEIEFGWIKGQQHAKRALELAAAGGHNVIMQGPPGAGKTLLAKAIISILPELSAQELLELTKIYSASGLLADENVFLKTRPFRSPHHTSSEPALIGGGTPIRPGEITLAHRGILFMDEFPEFHRDVLESLRQPLEEGKIHIQRAREQAVFPANFTLIAAANPCPCGYRDDPQRKCTCANSQIASYQRKLSGPLIDRFDIFCSVPAVKYEELVSPWSTSETEEARQRVAQARTVQKARLENEGILTNSEMGLRQIRKYCLIDQSSQRFLKQYVDSAKLSARGYHRVLKTARTIADLEKKENISFQNVSEALSFRLRKDS